jgi:hypothetical protein
MNREDGALLTSETSEPPNRNFNLHGNLNVNSFFLLSNFSALIFILYVPKLNLIKKVIHSSLLNSAYIKMF